MMSELLKGKFLKTDIEWAHIDSIYIHNSWNNPNRHTSSPSIFYDFFRDSIVLPGFHRQKIIDSIEHKNIT